ncbi:hypothetical protein BJX61DRAFT_539513 [Aspergillus egyptiacus]|nr:hypothetical protein BJX61DRAFT_539513 [Aspergillus egyptiacus]
MDPPSHGNSKRPPKLRSACNECHAAKVRCSGEKTGCQRCANLRLKCAFSISRIGKVPGKRSKANRVSVSAAAAAPASAPLSTSSAISTPIMSPPILTPTHCTESPRAYNGRTTLPASAPAPATCYPFPQAYPTALPFTSEPHHLRLHPGYPAQAATTEDLPSLSNLCWTSELDQLAGQGLLSPGWEVNADESLSPHSHPPPAYPDATANAKNKNSSRLYAPPPEKSLLSAQYTSYIHLLHSIDKTTQLSTPSRPPNPENNMHPSTTTTATTLDSILAANQRYLATLVHIADTSPAFANAYNEEHLLFTVALDKIIDLLRVGYAEFRRRMDVFDAMGTGMGMGCPGPVVDRWMRYGATAGPFEMDFVEQTGICRRVLAEEVTRARACLGRLTDAMGCGAVSLSGWSGSGRHEEFCEEMKKRLDALMEGLGGEGEGAGEADGVDGARTSLVDCH